ncbi:hypothetical protein B4V02_23975 [Paenibacillus kribbensis]|uniref:Uncharacterized protein n=1 Tax=Paenibacillus kribbensis TaxID=172713 RepID=A0A222WU76_9BACL|nr:hypothetical protein B4V02_23975 [Paenibacillus kribbensis]
MRLVIEYVELPYLLTVLELNLKKMKDSNFKLGHLFELHLKKIQDCVIKYQYRVRQAIRKRGIKVLDQHQMENCIMAKYLFRGYVHDARLLWGKVKSDTEVRLAAYLGI